MGDCINLVLVLVLRPSLKSQDTSYTSQGSAVGAQTPSQPNSKMKQSL